MSSEGKKTHDVPIPPTSILPSAPPKRFLGSSSHLFTPKKLGTLSTQLPVLIHSSLSSQQRKQLSPPPQLVTPPKLTRIPTLVVTPVDVSKPPVKEEIELSPTSACAALPPPPPLIKMPISTRKDKRSAATASSKATRNDGSESAEESDKQQEPPKKRAKAAEKSGVETSRAECTTPRKIIQEIFGPDKSKRPKGKGRKKRRGPTTPKKKILASACQEEEVEGEADDTQDQVEAHEQEGTSTKIEENENSMEEPRENSLPDVIMSKSATSEESVELQTDDVVKTEDQDIKDEVKSMEDGKNDNGEEEQENAEADQDVHEDNQDETMSVASSTSRRVSKRKAKVVAKQRLKRLSQGENVPSKVEKSSPPISGQEENDDESVTKEDTEVAGVQSRRSTFEGSSKSCGSFAQQDSESSSVGEGQSFNSSNRLEDNRRNFNPTPYSNVSDDEEGDEDDVKDEGAENVSMSDIHDHKDSDVDSTYSWKPVRAAAAAALEQVTRNQGSGSTGLPGDAEAKAAAAAERRARKINRYKGRNRRTIMFKSSSKKHTPVRNNRYSAQPTIAPKVFHHGHYFQAGDIIFIELADGTPMHGQIRGLLMDHFGQISAGIRFLAPKHPIYAFMEFEPMNFAFRYDVPEKLIKIEFVNFVMHLNLDYFDGHPSFSKIEKNTLYTRMGKSLQKSYEKNGSDSDSSTDSSSSSNSTGSENGETKKERKRKSKEIKETRRRHISDSSTDMDDAKTTNAEKIESEKAEEKSNNEEEDEGLEGEEVAGENQNQTESVETMEVM